MSCDNALVEVEVSSMTSLINDKRGLWVGQWEGSSEKYPEQHKTMSCKDTKDRVTYS